MASEHGFPEMDFSPGGPHDYAEASLNAIAESSIVRTILDGSGGPDNREMTEDGLRFIRYLLSISRSARFGFLPNFKDADSARDIARQFIRYCGSAALAMHTMHIVVEGES